MMDAYDVIATIRHNDESRTDRVALYRRDDSPYVWAAAFDESPYVTDVLVDDVKAAWGDGWDLQMI